MNKIRRERWIAVVNENDYQLDEKQAKVLSDAISQGSRGVVQFDGFIISIPFLQEFYLDKAWEEIKYSDEDFKLLETTKSEDIPQAITFTDEEKKLMIERSKLIARGYSQEEINQIENRKTLTPEEEKKRKQFLLKQAKKLKEQGL